MIAFGLSIFTGAFLLFLVQPLIAKFILPWFGGSPAVWTTCMLFFQVLLLGGYAYAHLISTKLKPRKQALLHLILLGVALTLLPITPSESWKPNDGSNPTWRILLLLLVNLGMPYLILSATGPLMQAWFSRVKPGVSPYRLYALSNVGSLLALIGYPLVVETNLSRHAQAVMWSIGLGVFAICCAWCALKVWSCDTQENAGPAAEVIASLDTPTPTNHRWLWFALPACASVLLLAVTNKICQDIAVIPFLWVLPLSLYLLTFIISFDSPRWYWRPVWLPLLAICFGALIWDHRWATGYSILRDVGIYLSTLFVSCLVCHGELYRLRPTSRGLTGFYLMISAGGAFGGIFVAVVAPAIFRHYIELEISFVLVAALVLAVLFVDRASWFRGGRPRWAWGLLLAAFGGMSWHFYTEGRDLLSDNIEVTRNFYGVLKVYQSSENIETSDRIVLMHGGTTHGFQYLADDKRYLPTTYYSGTSGIGLTMKHYATKTARRIGVVGLGAGTLAVYGRTNDYLRIYEINPEVPRIARQHFSYLPDCRATNEVILGDARLSLEREPDQQFDILALDAFSSDAIPVHLLTKEAFAIYQRHLKKDGVIAVHISNRYLNLQPIVLELAKHFGYRAAVIADNDAEERETEAGETGAYNSDWVLLSRDQSFLDSKAVKNATSEPDNYSPKIRMWTDEESNLVRILMF